MIIFFSGGSPIPEAQIKNPNIMLSFFVNRNKKDGGPDSRMRRVLKARRKSKNKESK